MKRIVLLILFIIVAISYGNTQNIVKFLLPDNCNASSTSVGEVNPGNNVKLELYPNPNKGSFILNLKSDTPIGEGIINIYNTMGQIIYSEKFFSEFDYYADHLNLSGIAPGIYFLSIGKGNQHVSTRLIIK